MASPGMQAEAVLDAQEEMQAAAQTGGETDPAATSRKRKAHAPLATPMDVISSALLSAESRAALRQQFITAQPYAHCIMSTLCRPDLLAAVREEIVHNIQATYKETDLFKLFQTGDLGNLDTVDREAAAQLPVLMALKAALYSTEFRDFVKDVTGCGELADKTDCSCNVYAGGGHLLCHDDVIGTRRVSWIIYLTDPDEPWTTADGGALELFPLVEGTPHTPAAHPTVCHLPIFNSMAMFVVLPGKSFHSVQEVMATDKPRMSISGWYHAPTEPQDAHLASLQQVLQRTETPEQLSDTGGLKAGQDNVSADQFQPFVGGMPIADVGANGLGELSEDDLSFLIRYINPTYLSEGGWPKVQAKFEAEGSVQLQQFLKPALASKIMTAAKAADAADKVGKQRIAEYTAGVSEQWSAMGPPHKQRYLQLAQQPTTVQAEKEAGVGSSLAQVRDVLFRSAAFARLIRAFTSLTMVGQRGEARRFRAGLDYTVAHYGILTKDPRLDVVLCFVDSGLEQGAGSSKDSGPWEDGEVGGFEAYLLADEDKEGGAAPEVYRQDAEESGVLNVSAASNSLNLVLRDEGLMRFVKYVSAAAPGSRWDVAMEYLPADDSDDDEAEDQNDKKP